MRGERWSLGLILAMIFGALAIQADQPIVENYVGRQIPTAMVARNLDRGSGFLHPMLDTGPFPNFFLVEPPIYAQLVAWVRSGIGFVWERSGESSVGFVWEVPGRLTSAVLMTLGAWSFYGLVRRREGPKVALVALASFGIFPVTLRYGRAFPPDAAMLGFVLAGMRCWDEYQAGGRRRWAWVGGLTLAVGLAIKITSAWVLIPFFLVVTRLPVRSRIGFVLAMVSPAVAWYLHAWGEAYPMSAAKGSLASLDNAAIWLRSFSPDNWLRFATVEAVARNLLVRAFTPLGFVLAMVGFGFVRAKSAGDRLWPGWGVGSGLAILALAAKWHHGYYWLVVAPLAALGVARALMAIGSSGRRGRIVAVALGVSLVGLGGRQAASTWRDPSEWGPIRESADWVASFLPANALLIAPEAVLYYADCRGFRLEFSPEAIRRASGEWGAPIGLDRASVDPMALVDFYAKQPGAMKPWFVADVGSTVGDERRTAWRAALRRRPNTRIIVNKPTLILAAIDEPILIPGSGSRAESQEPFSGSHPHVIDRTSSAQGHYGP